MTALECIRRGLGHHTVDIANFLIDYGIHFCTIEPLSKTPASASILPKCWYLGRRPDNYKFNLADFAGYEAVLDAFLVSQPADHLRCGKVG